MESNISTIETALAVCLGGNNHVPCDTFKHASDIVRNYISNFHLGSSDFYKRENAGMIFHPTKGIIANVSYNGRVWKSNGKFQLKSEEISNLLSKDLS
jgi:hypothetical protein